MRHTPGLTAPNAPSAEYRRLHVAAVYWRSSVARCLGAEPARRPIIRPLALSPSISRDSPAGAAGRICISHVERPQPRLSAEPQQSRLAPAQIHADSEFFRPRTTPDAREALKFGQHLTNPVMAGLMRRSFSTGSHSVRTAAVPLDAG